jgi:hypothetical protein
MYGFTTASLPVLLADDYAFHHAIGPEDMQVGRWFKHALPSVHLSNVSNGQLFCHDSGFHKNYPVGNVRAAWGECVK